MAFFKKLKERLFKSSSKLGEGLEAIVEDGGEVAEADLAPASDVDDGVVERERAAAEAARQEAERLEAARVAQERAELEARDKAEADRLEEERRAQERREQEAKEQAAAQQAAQEAADAARAAAEAARLEADRLEQARRDQEAQEQAARDAELAEQARLEDAARKAAAEDAARREAERAEAARLAAEAAEAARVASEKAEQQRQEALEKQRAEEDRARRAAEEAAAQEKERAQAEAARQAAQHAAQEQRAAEQAARERAEAERLAAEQTAQQAAKPGLLGRLFGRKDQKTVLRRTLDDDMLEQLEELLISADMGVDTALRVTANMAEGRFGKKLSVQEIKELMAQEIARIMDPVAKPLPIFPKTPQVVLVVGVNGSGKTTTIGKLASQFRAAGKNVVIAAGDTFRAAAVEQLQVWGDRAGVPVLTAPEGSDPASLAFEALEQATRDGADLLMIDTAGRLQNRSDLMEELAKIVRVIRKQDESAPHNTLLVLDATTGQNALSQVKIFQEVSDVSGLVMTKLDGTAKGGVLVALADKFGLPIHAIGVGEQIDDLAPFDPEEFAAALTGLETE